MRKFLSFLFLLMLLPLMAYGQEVKVVEKTNIVPIEKGEKAPFSGQLYSPETAIRWAFEIERLKTELRARVEREQKVCLVETSYRDRLLEIEEERASRVETDLMQRLRRAEKARIEAEHEAHNPPWYRHVNFGIGVGVVGTITILGTTAALFGQF